MNKKRTILLASLTTAFLSAMIPITATADSQLNAMISPVTNPINFEDPRIQTEIRPIYAYHKLSEDFVTGGGDVRVIAAQARLAITDDLAFIATKDGYFDINADEVLDDSNGAANLEAGFKYALLQDHAKGQIITGGLRYQLATGSPDVFQGQGDGIITPLISAATNVEGFNIITSTELRLALDNDDSTFWDLSAHLDRPIGKLFPLVELNMYHVVDAGGRIGLEGEGADVINFGSSLADGTTVVTMGMGARYRVCENFDLGAAYETALTDGDDVFDWRITTDAIIRFDI